MKHRNRLKKAQKAGWLKHGSIFHTSGLEWAIVSKNGVTVHVQAGRLIFSDIYEVIDETIKGKKL